MTRRIFCKVLLVAVAIFGLLVLSGVLSAQGRSEDAFDRVREVQERNTGWLMAIDGVEGTAIGLNPNARLALKVFTAGPGVAGIPQTLDGVPVQVVVTGKFYALAPPMNRPPKPPRALTATAVSDTVINLDWRDNHEPDLSRYNVYRSEISGDYGETPPPVSVTSSSYSDSGLTAGTTYYYVVTAVDDTDNESDPSDEASATPGEPEPEPPPEELLDPTSRWPRPVPIGVSTGNEGECSSGTIGCRVTDGTDVFALSNNHVYALENDADIGSEVLQPGLYDTDCVYDADNVIGTLADFEPIDFSGGNNTIDAAIAEIIIDVVGGVDIPRVGNATPADGYGTPKSATVGATLAPTQYVQKYGRTSRLTKGHVYAVEATVDVGTAHFVNQIVVYSSKRPFIKPGDSGSLLVTDPGRNPVGLLFAGNPSGKYAIANPIGAVLTRFSVTIDGE